MIKDQTTIGMPARGMFFSGAALSEDSAELNVPRSKPKPAKTKATSRKSGPKGGKAAILDDEQLRRAFRFVEEHCPVVEPARLKLALAFYAGLRACQISKLTIYDVTTTDGEIDTVIRVPAAKYSPGFEVPLVPPVAEALRLFRERFPHVERLAICKANARPQSPNTVARWFGVIFRQIGYQKASSHSGRRTFLTKAARAVAKTGGSIADVQKLAGHANMASTEPYIAVSNNLVALANATAPEHLPWEPLPRGPAPRTGGRP